MKLVCVLTFLTLTWQRPEMLSYRFIGYKNEQPVFASFGTAKQSAFQLDDSLRQRNLIFSQTGVPLFINNCGTAFYIDKNRQEVVYQIENRTDKFRSAMPITEIQMTNDCQIIVVAVEDTIT